MKNPFVSLPIIFCSKKDVVDWKIISCCIDISNIWKKTILYIEKPKKRNDCSNINLKLRISLLILSPIASSQHWFYNLQCLCLISPLQPYLNQFSFWISERLNYREQNIKLLTHGLLEDVFNQAFDVKSI